MKYILMMNATKADFDWYAKWSKQDLQANFAFMRAFNKVDCAGELPNRNRGDTARKGAKD